MLIDLSHPLTTGMQIFPGDPAVELTPVANVADDGVLVNSIHLGTHTGTHVDAPSHCLQGAAHIDEIDLARFHGTARIVRVPQARSMTQVKPDDVEDQLSQVRAGEIVLFETGWSRHFNSARYVEHPYLATSIGEALLTRGVRSVGVDALSPDRTSMTEADQVRLPFHELFLGAGGVIYENLTNLAAVAGPTVGFSGFPLRMSGVDGSPVRAVAFTSVQ